MIISSSAYTELHSESPFACYKVGRGGQAGNKKPPTLRKGACMRRSDRLASQQHLATEAATFALQRVEIHAGAKVGSVKDKLMLTSFHHTVQQSGNFATGQVIDLQAGGGSHIQLKTNDGAGIEGIGIVAHQLETACKRSRLSRLASNRLHFASITGKNLCIAIGEVTPDLQY